MMDDEEDIPNLLITQSKKESQSILEEDQEAEIDISMIQKTFDEEMKVLVKEYQDKKVIGDRGSELVMRKIRLKHPIFSLITISAFKYLVENGYFFKLKEGQTVYREKQIARANVYFVLYGQFNFTSQFLKLKENNEFGEIIGLGWTIGEEILYGSKVD